jgi:hypothetical protein
MPRAKLDNQRDSQAVTRRSEIMKRDVRFLSTFTDYYRRPAQLFGKAPNIYGRLGFQAPQGPGRPAVN